MSQETETARAVLADLEEKLAATRARLAATDEEVESVSYAAHTGDAAAAKKLQELYVTSSRYGAEAKGLEVAVAEAKRRLAAAEADERAAQHVEAAREALKIVDAFEARSKALDAAMTKFVEEFKALEAEHRKLIGLGFPATSWDAVRVNLGLATQTALMRIGAEGRFLQPHDRRSFTEVFDAWSRGVRARATAVIKPKAAKAS